jgi:hypothetical protein
MMANYEDVWGAAHKTWKTIPIRDRHISNAGIAAAWGGMICFFIFAILSLVTTSNIPVFLMLASMAVWIFAGYMVVRIKRKERKILTFEK